MKTPALILTALMAIGATFQEIPEPNLLKRQVPTNHILEVKSEGTNVAVFGHTQTFLVFDELVNPEKSWSIYLNHAERNSLEDSIPPVTNITWTIHDSAVEVAILTNVVTIFRTNRVLRVIAAGQTNETVLKVLGETSR